MDRSNCGCAPYNPSTNRNDYLKELYETCDCVLPCESCECVKQTGTCPPPPPCKPVQQMKCCVEKPKKGFWQLLFGGKKCSPIFKKKQDKKRYQVRKLKCVPLPNLKSELLKDNENQQAAVKLDSNSCPRKGCFPTPKSICGCHFYFNVENRTRRHVTGAALNDQQICENNETPLEYGYAINEEPEHDNLAASREEYSANNTKPNKRNKPVNSISSPHDKHDKRSEGNTNVPNSYLTHNKRFTANGGGKRSAVAFNPYDGQSRRSTGISYNGQQKSSLCSRKRQSSVPTLPLRTENLSKNDVHIGLTFTKETKYFIPNKDACLSEENSNGECNNYSHSNNSKENSEQLLTVEIHKSFHKLSHNEDTEEVKNSDELNDHILMQTVPSSESYSREVFPLMKRKGPVDGPRRVRHSMSEDDSEERTENTQRQSNKNRQSLTSNRSSKANLGRRVSEILKKLNEIENKINSMEKKGQDNKKIRLDFDGAKSKVSLHIKDPPTKNVDNGYNNKYNTSKRGSGNTVIEIRHTHSKSPVLRSSQENEIRSSQSLDIFDKKQPSSHKIVIKLPKINGKTQCVVLPDRQNTKAHEISKDAISWHDVSNELKCSPPKVSNKCYCYECLQKRLRCL